MGTSVTQIEDTYARWLKRTDEQLRAAFDAYDAAVGYRRNWSCSARNMATAAITLLAANFAVAVAVAMTCAPLRPAQTTCAPLPRGRALQSAQRQVWRTHRTGSGSVDRSSARPR